MTNLIWTKAKFEVNNLKIFCMETELIKYFNKSEDSWWFKMFSLRRNELRNSSDQIHFNFLGFNTII